MLALIGNLSFGELVLIGVAAVLVFGKRLPEVAGQAMSHVSRFRRSLDDLRRETGIDREMRDMRQQFDDVTREATQIIESPARVLTESTNAPTANESARADQDPAKATPLQPEDPNQDDQQAADRPRSS